MGIARLKGGWGMNRLTSMQESDRRATRSRSKRLVGALIAVTFCIEGALATGLVEQGSAHAQQPNIGGVPPSSGKPVSGELPRVLPDVPQQNGPTASPVGPAPVATPIVPTPSSMDAGLKPAKKTVVSRVPAMPKSVRPAADPSTLVELPALRTATRQVFLRTDGLQEVHESSMPVNYQDSKGQWQPIDNHLVEDGAGGFSNKANSFTVSFQRMRPGAGVQISAPDGLVRMVAEGADSSVVPVLSADGLSITYPDVVPGSDLVYTVTGAGLEEDLVVKSSLSTPQVSFVVTGAGLAKDTPGLRGGNGSNLAARLRISNPETFDARGRAVSMSSQVFSATDTATGLSVPDVSALTLAGSTAVASTSAVPGMKTGSPSSRVTIGLDSGWVKAQPAAAFPVTVDPSVTLVFDADALVAYGVHANTGAAYTNFADGYARTGNPGIGGAYADVAYRTVVHFPFESYIGLTSVDNAFLATTVVSGSSSGGQPLNVNWASQWGWHYGATPNNGWGWYVSSTINSGTQWLSANGSGSELRWMYDPFVRNGNSGAALLLTSAESGYTLKKFAVQLVLVINRWPPGAPASISQPSARRVTVAATPVGDADGDSVLYAFYLQNASGTWWYDTNTGLTTTTPSAYWGSATTVTLTAPLSMSNSTVTWGVATYDQYYDAFLGEYHVSYNSGAVAIGNALPAAAALSSPANGSTWRFPSQTLSATIPQQLDADGDQVQQRFFYCPDSTCSVKNWVGSWTNVTAPNQPVSQAIVFPVTAPFTQQSFWWGVGTTDNNPGGNIQFSPYWGITIRDQAPTATLQSPVNGTILNGSRPTLTAVVSDPDPEDTTVSYRFVVTPSSGSGMLAASPWSASVASGSTVSWTLPEGLASGAGYQWHVEVKDPGQLSASSSLWSLKTQGRLGADPASPMQTVGVGQVNLATGNLFVAGGAGKTINTVGGTIGVGLSYNSQDRSVFGLRGQYGTDTNANDILDSSEVLLSRVDSLVSFDWGSGSPGASVPVDNFAASWDGYMRVPQLSGGSGTHVWRFAGGHDDKVTIKVTGTGSPGSTLSQTTPTTVFTGPSWIALGDPSVFTAIPSGTPTPVTLVDGELVKVHIDLKEYSGAAAIELRAQSDGNGTLGSGTEQQVTQDWFSITAPPLPAGWTLATNNGLDGAWTQVSVQADGVIATAGDGSSAFFTKTVNSGVTAWQPPPGLDDVLVVNADSTTTVHGSDGLVYRFDNTGAFTSVETSADDLQPAGAATTSSNGGASGAPFKSTALTDRLAATRSIKLWYQQTGLTPVGGCPSAAGYTTPPDGMLCRIDYPDGTQSKIYYQNGLVARISDPGDETNAASATLPAPEGRAITDFGYDSSGNMTSIMSPISNDRVAAQTASPSLAQIPAAELAVNLTWNAKKVGTVTLPRPAIGQTRPVTTMGYGAVNYTTGGTTTVQVTGITGNARSVAFDPAGRMTSDTDSVGRTSTTQWSPGLDAVLWKTSGGRTSSTVYDPGWHPLDTYGPVPTACYGTLPTTITETTNGPVPLASNPGCSSGGIPQIPHTHTDYDVGLFGLTAAVWSNTSRTGQTSAHRMAPVDAANGIQYNDSNTTAGWSARYTGLLYPAAQGSYSLQLYTAGATSAALYINDVEQANLGVGQSTTISFAVGADLKPWRIRLDTSTTTTTENVSLWWTTPSSSVFVVVPNSVLKPGFWYPNKTTTDDTSASVQVPAQSIATSAYNDNGMDPSYGMVTSNTADQSGVNLKTLTGYETPAAGSLLRRLTHTLPAFATSASAANSTTSGYYPAATVVSAPSSCVAGASADQGQLVQFTTSATGASGLPVKTEQIHDILGRVIASRNWNGATPEAAWTCTTYDGRGRVSKIAYPAFGASPARTVTTTYRAPFTTGGTDYDPFTTAITDSAGSIKTIVDGLGRVVSTTDVWSLTTTSTYDSAGRLSTTTGPAGVMVYSYDNAGRITQQSLDSKVVVTTGYRSDGATLDPGILETVTYPSGTGNGGNGTAGTISYDPYGRISGVSWKKGTTLITSDTVNRSLTSRVLTDFVDGSGTPTWSYQYDSVGRLIRATGTGHDYQYGYGNTNCTGTNNNPAAGSNGNRTSVRDNGVTTQASCYDAADRLTTYGTPTASYTSRLNTPAAPTFYWRLGDLSGTTATATNGGAANNGTYSASGVTLNQGGAPTGDTNPSVSFSGGNVQIPIATLTGSGKTFTLWFKTASNGVLLSKNRNASGGAVGSPNPMLYVGTDGKLRAQVFGGAINPITTTRAVNDNNWHHVVLSVAPTTQTLYLDGVKMGSLSGSSVDDSWNPLYAYVGTGATTLCCWPATTGTWMPFTGSIDEVAIYSVAMSDTNVAAQDNPAPSTGLVSPAYDYRGNVTALNGDAYTYDSADRHTSTTHGTTTVTYIRDATDNIVARTDSSTGVTVRYSGAAVLNTSNTVLERTIGLPGGVLVTKRSAGDVWSYPNIHGDIVATANSSGSKQGSTISYDPYGNGTAPDNSNGNWDYGWIGQNMKGTEHATSLLLSVEMGARIYSPVIGRFLETDPVAGGSANDYDYANGEPINQFDLTGNWPHLHCGFCSKAIHAVTGVAKKTYQAARFVVNAPVTIYALVGVKATAGSSNCGMNWSQIMVVCKGANHGGLVRGGGTTYGSLFVTSEQHVSNELLAHEAKHADQWALLGPVNMAKGYGVSYLAQGKCNFFEWWAGYKNGGYTCG